MTRLGLRGLSLVVSSRSNGTFPGVGSETEPRSGRPALAEGHGEGDLDTGVRGRATERLPELMTTDEESAAHCRTLVEVEGLHQYTLSVASLDEAVAWYARVLGFKPTRQTSTHPWGRAAYMQGPGLMIEILEVPDPGPLPPYAAGPEPDTDLTVCGHKHFALLHPDVAAAVRELKALGEDILSHKRVQLEGVGEFVAVFIADNTGGLIELPQGREVACESDPVERSKGEVSPAPLGITKLHHIAVCVPDREEAVRWYSNVLGFSLATSFEVPSIGLRSAMMQAPGFWLEIHCKAGSASVPGERRNPHTDVQTLGNKYFSLAIRDAAAALDLLQKTGIDIVAKESRLGPDRFFIRDTSGNPIELVQVVQS
jgi:methylmalonyl-CoA/ethylmalonyl-CoA epimerase